MKYTRKQLGGYAKANRNWISENDSYNLEAFGITKKQYFEIRRIEQETHGFGGEHITLAELNKRL